MSNSLDQLRRKAKALRRAYAAHDPQAADRVRAVIADGPTALKHADFLHVIAREADFESWPRLKLAVETEGLDRAGKQQRLKIALFHGQNWVAERLLADTPDLARGILGLEIALLDLPAVQAALAGDAGAATRTLGPRRPILHLTFSQWHKAHPDLRDDMLEIARLLVDAGADVNDGYASEPGSDHKLSALYGALGHAGNLPLARWLLEHGATPDDGESLYHATELGHRDGLRLLLEFGARPAGTNALLRALDFNDHAAVALLLAAGADPNEGVAAHGSGQPPAVIPALHQAVRRLCDGDMIAQLLAAGANHGAVHDGVHAYALARVCGNAGAASAIAAAGGDTTLTAQEAILATAAEGTPQPGVFLNPDSLPGEYRGLMGRLLHLPGKLAHLRALADIGLEHDRPDEMGVTPVQAAGWEGMADVMALFMALRPDISHVNNYGGTLLSTIIHGSENCPQRDERDHVACLEMALNHGVALPRRAVERAGDPAVAALLGDWAQAHPGQVVEGGVA